LEKSGKAITAQGDSAWAVQDKSVSIGLTCATFGIFETCYRYRRILNAENEEIADWLLRLTICYQRWGFGLCSH